MNKKHIYLTFMLLSSSALAGTESPTGFIPGSGAGFQYTPNVTVEALDDATFNRFTQDGGPNQYFVPADDTPNGEPPAYNYWYHFLSSSASSDPKSYTYRVAGLVNNDQVDIERVAKYSYSLFLEGINVTTKEKVIIENSSIFGTSTLGVDADVEILHAEIKAASSNPSLSVPPDFSPLETVTFNLGENSNLKFTGGTGANAINGNVMFNGSDPSTYSRVELTGAFNSNALKDFSISETHGRLMGVNAPHINFEVDSGLVSFEGTNTINKLKFNGDHNITMISLGSKINIGEKVEGSSTLVIAYNPQSLSIINSNFATIYSPLDSGKGVLVSSGGNTDMPFTAVYTIPITVTPDGEEFGDLAPIEIPITGTSTTSDPVKYLLSVNFDDTKGVTIGIGTTTATARALTPAEEAAINALLASNPSFNSLTGDGSSSSSSSSSPPTPDTSPPETIPTDIDAATTSNAVTLAIQSNLSSAGKDAVNSIRGADGFLPHIDPKTYKRYKAESGDQFEAMMRAMADNGPFEAARDEKRVWVSPFHTSGATNATEGSPSQSRALMGSLVGTEYRDLKRHYTVGLVGGYSQGKQEEKKDPLSHSKSSGLIMGLYHTKGIVKGAAYELILTRVKGHTEGQRHGKTTGGSYLAYSSHDSLIHTVDFQGNYKWNLPRKGDSIRVNLGMTYIHFDNDGYSERGAPTSILNYTHAPTSGASREMYGGVGYRRSWRLYGDYRIRTTLLYEFGYEISKSGSPGRVSLANGSREVITPNGPKEKTHYMSINSSILNDTKGIKGVLGYLGALKKGERNHTVTMKWEYRW